MAVFTSMLISFLAHSLFSAGVAFLQITCLKGLQNRPRSVPNAHLGKDARKVILYRSFRNCERIGDFAVAVAARHQPENLDLAPTERFGSVRTGKIALNPVEIVE